jgi:hypothetical protein
LVGCGENLDTEGGAYSASSCLVVPLSLCQRLKASLAAF